MLWGETDTECFQDNPELGARVFMGYVVGGTTLVGNWRIMEHPNEPVTFEGAWVMSKRAE